MQSYNHIQAMVPLENHHQPPAHQAQPECLDNGNHSTPAPSPHQGPHTQQNDTAFPGGQLRHSYNLHQQQQQQGHLLNLAHQPAKPKLHIPKNSQAFTNDHMERHSRGEKVERVYDCPECDKAFTREEHLKRHSKVHTEDPVHRCEVIGCSKSYTRKERLTRHYKVAHLGQEPDRPFWCSDCGKDFQRKEHLHRHQRNIHGQISGTQPSGPNPANQAAAAAAAAPGIHHLHHPGHPLHQQHHPPPHHRPPAQHHHHSHHRADGANGQILHCTYEGCPKTYSRREHLNRHIKLHMGIEPDRPFYCLDCGKTFTRKEHLKRHVRVHTGEHPYPCSECGRSFGRRERLVKHLKTHGVQPATRSSGIKREFKKEPELSGHGVFGDQTTQLLNMIAKKGPLAPEQLGMCGPNPPESMLANPEVAKALANPDVVRAFSNPDVVKAFALGSPPKRAAHQTPTTSSSAAGQMQHVPSVSSAGVPPELSKLPPGFSIFPVVPAAAAAAAAAAGQDKAGHQAGGGVEQGAQVVAAMPAGYYQANPQAHPAHLKPGDIATIPMTWAGWPVQSVNIRSPAKLEPGDTKHWEPTTYFRTTFS